MKYTDIIELFLKYNPTPSDEQVHNLAYSLGVDKETLEAIVYEMLSTELNDVGVLADVIDTYEGKVPDTDLNSKEVSVNDGYYGQADVEEEQRSIRDDGTATGVLEDIDVSAQP